MIHAAAPSPKSSRAERDLRVLLMKSNLPVTFRFATREGPYTCDFLFVEWKLCVELDGPFHDAAADEIRDRNLARMGLATFRLPFDMPSEAMLRHILYVGGRIKYKPMPEKVLFLRGYRTTVLGNSSPEPSARRVIRPHEDCVDCGGSGWKIVPAWSEFLKKAVRSATRCPCENLRPQRGLTLSSENEPTLGELLYEVVNRKPPQQATLGLFQKAI